MRQNIEQHVQSVVENTKIAASASIVTTATGLATFFSYIPSILGSVASLTGIVLTWFLICKVRTETAKVKLEMKVLRRREQAHHDEVEHRAEEGQPCRRESDKG